MSSPTKHFSKACQKLKSQSILKIKPVLESLTSRDLKIPKSPMPIYQLLGQIYQHSADKRDAGLQLLSMS